VSAAPGPTNDGFTMIGRHPVRANLVLILILSGILATVLGWITGSVIDGIFDIAPTALIVIPAFFLLTAWATLVTFAIIGIASWLPAWLSALIVTVFFLLVAVVLILVGVKSIKKAVPPVPQDSIESIKKDVQAFKGVGSYDH
jgi:hypothetical protein